jgi:hypothetical protein
MNTETQKTEDGSSLDVAAGSACRHECTQGREGQTGLWCVKCGLKIYEVDPRECQHCAHFKDVGFTGDPRSICTKHLMGVTRDMHVTYDLAKGTCFSPTT